MGYILTPIAVDLDQVAGVAGSRSKELLDTIVKQFGTQFADIDEMTADFVDVEDGGETTTVRDALTQIIMGEGYNEEVGFVYGYALEFICRHLGDPLPNHEWVAMRSEWATKADKALQTAGIEDRTLRLVQLMYRGSPMALPEIEDFPGIGYMRLGEIKTALAAFEEGKLASVTEKDMRAALAEVRGWLQSCVQHNRDLICFYA